MAKFCTNCGKPLTEGQQCECFQNTVSSDTNISMDSQQSANAQNNQTNDIVAYLKAMYAFGISFIKSPSSMIKLVAQKEDFKIGLFFLGLQAIATSLLAMLMLNRAAKATIDFFGGLGSLLGMAFRGNGPKIPYFSIFFKDVIFIAIQFFALACIIFVISKFLFKGKGFFKALIGVLGVATIPLSVTLLASLILVFISFKLVLYVVIFSIILTMLLNVFGIKETFRISDDRVVYSLTLSYLVYYFLLFTIISENIKSSLGGLF